MLEDELGDIIGKARLGLAISPGQLAAATGLSLQELAEIEAYRLMPDADRLEVLARTLSLDPEKLAGIAAGWLPEPVTLPRGTMIVETVPVPYGSYGENCYVIGCAETLAGAVIDPGGAVDAINAALTQHGLTLDLVLLTHSHGDHIGGLKPLVAGRPAIRLANHQLERDSVIRGLANPWEPATDGIPIKLGSLTITPLFTPGHTPGSTCYLASDACFVGDTLFSGSIGRPASPAAYQSMLAIIGCKLLSLPDSTIVLPGHGPASTVGEENGHNPFF
jgi:hydroxyacylglutathione hydrolase